MRDDRKRNLAHFASGLAALAALFLSGCCFCAPIPVDGDNPTSVLIIGTDAFVPMAIVLALYLRAERRYRPAWAKRHVLMSGLPGGAYRSAEVAFASVAIPRSVRIAACLGFIDLAASLPALVEAGDLAHRSWNAGGGATRLAMRMGPLVIVVAIDAVTAWYGRAILARTASARWTRRVGGLLVLMSLCLLALGLIAWRPLLLDLATLLHQPANGPPSFGPTTLTLTVALAVVAWPVLELLTGVALLRAAPELDDPP